VTREYPYQGRTDILVCPDSFGISEIVGPFRTDRMSVSCPPDLLMLHSSRSPPPQQLTPDRRVVGRPRDASNNCVTFHVPVCIHVWYDTITIRAGCQLPQTTRMTAWQPVLPLRGEPCECVLDWRLSRFWVFAGLLRAEPLDVETDQCRCQMGSSTSISTPPGFHGSAKRLSTPGGEAPRTRAEAGGSPRKVAIQSRPSTA